VGGLEVIMTGATALKVGDTVSLKSGGPLMTIDSIKDEDSVTCRWFAKDVLKQASFFAATLRKVDGPQTLDEMFSDE
jgi:uncharacterized protein YodC (DUF2158 family)